MVSGGSRRAAAAAGARSASRGTTARARYSIARSSSGNVLSSAREGTGPQPVMHYTLAERSYSARSYTTAEILRSALARPGLGGRRPGGRGLEREPVLERVKGAVAENLPVEGATRKADAALGPF